MQETSARQPDAKIKAARENWMVRLTTAGVPLTDFIEVTQSIDIWDDWCRACVEFNRKLIKKGPNVQLKIDHVLNPTCLVIRQEAQGDHNGHDWQGQKA